MSDPPIKIGDRVKVKADTLRRTTFMGVPEGTVVQEYPQAKSVLVQHDDHQLGEWGYAEVGLLPVLPWDGWPLGEPT